VLLFKTLALTQLFLLYLFPTTDKFEFDVVSAIMIFTGYTVSIMATHALGLDRTYFGVELGICEYKCVNQFPYGFLPHPMILSQIWALLGFFKASNFRSMYPYLVPVHVCLYLAHMVIFYFIF
jgi:Phospholipid methyltransferase